MGITETLIDIPAEHERNVCGQFDAYVKKIEKTLRVTMISRDGSIKVIGPEAMVGKAARVFSNLIELSRRGNTITEQNVDYALALTFEEKENQILEIDRDLICRTVAGKPVKPKTVGQKQYVDAIREKMIVFGLGRPEQENVSGHGPWPIQAFKNNEVGRIILTRPAIEAGEKLGFLPEIFRARSIPTCGLYMMPFMRSWGRIPIFIMQKRGLLRWRRLPTCADGPWIMPISFWTRLRTPLRHR